MVIACGVVYKSKHSGMPQDREHYSTLAITIPIPINAWAARANIGDGYRSLARLSA